MVQLTLKLLTPETIRQYQKEERTLIARRSISSHFRLNQLIDVMGRDTISQVEKVKQLSKELAEHYKNEAFTSCHSMGELVKTSLRILTSELT